MEEISVSISKIIGLLVWSDWLTIVILLVFTGLGIKYALVAEVVKLIFFIIVLFEACLLYEKFSYLAIIRRILNPHQSQLTAAL